jgi:hypothetical protein
MLDAALFPHSLQKRDEQVQVVLRAVPVIE